MAVKVNRNLTTVNYTHANNTSKVWAGQKRSIEWIVLHYTANGKSYKGMAYNNTAYFKSVYRGCSAHYFVDDAEIWQCVEDRDSSWHCGDAASRNGCHNWNSIGIEICDNNGEITPAAEALAVQLVKLKMKQYNIPITRVCRHYDVTGKQCPLWFVPTKYQSEAVANARWAGFKALVSQKMGGSTDAVEQKASFKVKILDDALNVRKAAGVENPIVGVIHKGEVYTIVDIKKVGSSEWGKLKSGLGWINIGTKYVKRV